MLNGIHWFMADKYPGTEKDRSVHAPRLHLQQLSLSTLLLIRHPKMSRSRSLPSTVLEGRGPPPEVSSIRSPPKTPMMAKQKLWK
jgi:hypothetical protein